MSKTEKDNRSPSLTVDFDYVTHNPSAVEVERLD